MTTHAAASLNPNANKDKLDLLGFDARPAGAQNAIDLFAGLWKAKLPAASGLVGGDIRVFDNGLVAKVDAALGGGVRGARVLEIGPYEGHYSYQLEKAGAADVVAIEVNKINFLKCLVVKETLGLKTSFLLGDFAITDTQSLGAFDLCFAAGVLYHQKRPVEFLDKLCQTAPTLYLWTHVFSESIDLSAKPHFRPELDEVTDFRGQPVTLHHRSYNWRGGAAPHRFSGGPQEYAYWLRFDDIVRILNAHGFEIVSEIARSDAHDAGPVVALVARRP